MLVSSPVGYTHSRVSIRCIETSGLIVNDNNNFYERITIWFKIFWKIYFFFFSFSTLLIWCQLWFYYKFEKKVQFGRTVRQKIWIKTAKNAVVCSIYIPQTLISTKNSSEMVEIMIVNKIVIRHGFDLTLKICTYFLTKHFKMLSHKYSDWKLVFKCSINSRFIFRKSIETGAINSSTWKFVNAIELWHWQVNSILLNF